MHVKGLYIEAQLTAKDLTYQRILLQVNLVDSIP